MKSLKMYCFSLANSNLEKIKKINYIPVGLGKEKFDKEWLRENTKDNISEKIVGTEKILFITGCGKMNQKKTLIQIGSDFVTIEDFGLKIVKKKSNWILNNQLFTQNLTFGIGPE